PATPSQRLGRQSGRPAVLARWLESCRRGRERPVAGGGGGLEPARDPLVEDRVRAALAHPLQAPGIAGPAIELQAAAPALELRDGEAVKRERLVDQAARRMRRVLARREL